MKTTWQQNELTLLDVQCLCLCGCKTIGLFDNFNHCANVYIT